MRLATITFGALVVVPAAVQAQTVLMHTATYTKTLTQLTSTADEARTNMPTLDARRVPPSSFLERNSKPAGLPAAGTSLASGPASPVASDAYGSDSLVAIAPYSTAAAYVQFGGPTPTTAAVPTTAYPWRATGKLQFSLDGAQYNCSGALIKPGLLLTAAHCVFEYGRNAASGYHSDYVFAPGKSDSNLLGTWTAAAEFVPAAYYKGDDTCYDYGIVCNNDIAILVMNRDGNGVLPGTRLSWYNYGYNGYSFLKSFGSAFLAHITQLGYPVAFDGGLRMERNDGVGALFTPGGGLYNMVLGSAMTGGSSGGPWLVNFGTRPTIDPSRATLGIQGLSNVVVGVTSWGYSSLGTNTQGASWFGQNAQFPGSSYSDTHGVYRGAGNIGALVSEACSKYFDHC